MASERSAACINGKAHEWRKGRCVRCGAYQPRHDESSAASIEGDVVTLRKALDYPKLGYGYAYREALEALDRLAEAAHQSNRLRREVALPDGWPVPAPKGHPEMSATTEPRVSYDGPIEVGMVMVGLGNEGEAFRRDLVLGFHPLKKGLVIYEALPCKMRKRLGSGVGEIGLCPEVNMRYVMRPEEAVLDAPE